MRWGSGACPATTERDVSSPPHPKDQAGHRNRNSSRGKAREAEGKPRAQSWLEAAEQSETKRKERTNKQENREDLQDKRKKERKLRKMVASRGGNHEALRAVV